jgi:hypothetical protein
LCFPDFPTTFGTSPAITALLACTNAAWTMTVRGDSNEVLRTFSGIATNGRIDVFWDSTDSNGVSSFDGDFINIEVTTSSSGEAKHPGDSLSGVRPSKPTVTVHRSR